FRDVAVPDRRELLGGSDAGQTGAPRPDAQRQPGRRGGDAGGGRAGAGADGAERRDPAARAGRARGPEPAGACGVHVAALRRPIDRGNLVGAGTGNERGEAQRVSRGEEAARGAGAAQESGIVRHYTEDDLTLYYYGEGRRRADIEVHLEGCAACASLYREIAGTLAMIAAPEVPERGDQYGLEVWQRIRHKLPEPAAPWWAGFFRYDRLALAAAAAVLLVVAVLAGRPWQQPASRAASAPAASPPAGGAPAASDTRQRILLTSVAEHLDRSERVLTDIMNAPDRGDISTEQKWADDLVDASRIYRQDAIEAGGQSGAAGPARPCRRARGKGPHPRHKRRG